MLSKSRALGNWKVLAFIQVDSFEVEGNVWVQAKRPMWLKLISGFSSLKRLGLYLFLAQDYNTMSPDLGLKLGPLDPEHSARTIRLLSPTQKESKKKAKRKQKEAAELLFYL